MRKYYDSLLNEGVDLARCRFVTGLSLGGAALGLQPFGLLGGPGGERAVTTLQGRVFNLTVSQTAVNFTGSARVATTVNGTLPAPTLRWRGGSYWYHSHSGFQEQTGLYGTIVIDPKESESSSYDRDYVMVLSDWTDEDPNGVYAKLKKLSHDNNNERTHGGLMRDSEQKGLSATWNERKMWSRMRMSQRDLSDVTGSTIPNLENSRPTQTSTGRSASVILLISPGRRVRISAICSGWPVCASGSERY